MTNWDYLWIAIRAGVIGGVLALVLWYGAIAIYDAFKNWREFYHKSSPEPK